MIDVDSLVQVAIVGIFTGFGSSLGNYLAQRSFIRHLEKISLKDKK
jgi:recombination DNA repair RAD52 pathway protein